MDLGLRGKVAFVAAATKGLGRACAEALASEGASVAICARNKENVERAAKEIERSTGASRVLPVVADVGVAADCERAVKETVAGFGGLHVMIANGGGPPPGRFEELDEEKWRVAVEGTLLSCARLFRAALPPMKAAKWGRMLVITSNTVREPATGLLLSNAIRPGIAGLCKTLSKELGQYGITVNNVAPGLFDTERLAHVFEKASEAGGITFEEARIAGLKTIPLGRFGDTKELARVVAFLASEAASYVSGQTIAVDGGKMACI
jgi:3-oxoacyl-[acyl-carrier protein] reductase